MREIGGLVSCRLVILVPLTDQAHLDRIKVADSDPAMTRILDCG